MICPKVFVSQRVDLERMAVLPQEPEQPANLGVICTDRVRAAVGFELKPAKVFMRGGLQGEWHVEAGHMIDAGHTIIDARWGLSAL